MHMIPAGTVALLTLFTLSAGVPAAPLVFEAETCSTPTDAWIRNRDTPDHWNLWSTDKNAKNWSGGVVLRAPTVHTDRTAPEQGAPALHTRLTGIPPGTYHVEVKPGGRPLGLSLDGTHWVKFRGGFIARDVAIRDGTFELWADDRYACDPGPGAGSGYYDTIVLHPKIESVNGVPNPGFELADEPGAPPPGWTWHTNGTPSPTLTQAPDAHSGRRALRIRAEADARWYLRATERFKVAPGDEYRLIAWIKSASPNGVRMGLAGFDPEGAPAGRFGRGEMGAALTDWTQLRGFALVPDGVAEASVSLEGKGPADLLLDDVALERFTFARPTLPKVKGHAAQRVVEKLDRAPVALPTETGHHVSWRLLREDPPDIAFNVYRQSGREAPIRVNREPIRYTTDLADPHPPLPTPVRYTIRTVRDGVEYGPETLAVAAAAPADGRPACVTIRLRGAHDFRKVAVADLDGDGRYDYVIKQPGANVDPGESYWKRSEGTYRLEAYRSDGALLWDRDLGFSIEQGVWYSPYIAFDLDGDGRAELAAKTGAGDPRDPDGRVTSGPEWLVVWDGATGRERARTPWIERESFERYNLASRNQIAVAYLDGKTPCLIMLRGTYGRMRAVALEFHGNALRQLWSYDNAEFGARYWGQGAHFTHAADLDGDGRDEVLLGSAVLDDNGAPLWSTGLGHPDHFYVTDAMPHRPGLEIYYGIETAGPRHTMCMADAATGKILWGWDQPTRHIHGSGLCSDIDAAHPGAEAYGADSQSHKPTGDRWLWNAEGKILSREIDMSFGRAALFWDADLQREIVAGDGIRDFGGAIPLAPSPKGPVVLIADLLGDWREEIVASIDGELRIHSSAIPATDRRPCLMQDPIYRLDVALTAMGYTQVPNLSRLPESDAPGLNLTALEPRDGIAPCRAVVSGPMDQPLRGTLRFAAPDATVTPQRVPVDLAPGKRMAIECGVTPSHRTAAHTVLNAELDGAPAPLRAATPIARPKQVP